MGQSYIDNETAERFMEFFKGENMDDLNSQMEEKAKELQGKATLEHEVTGETLEDVREQLRAKLKEELYGGGTK